MKKTLLLTGFAVTLMASQAALAMSFGQSKNAEPLYPVTPLIIDKHVDMVYPSVAGDFMVYSTMTLNHAGVVRVSKFSPQAAVREVKPMVIDEAIRFGVAVQDGSVGYVSNRVGPVSAWMWRGHGESHLAIISGDIYRGGVVPYHLNASRNGKVWCFDTPFQKMRLNELLGEFSDHPHSEIIGQLWRAYDSDSFRYKAGYRSTETGKKNKFDPASLYILDRTTHELSMIPNAFDGAVSPDGRKVVFVRETNGNYDLWMQDVNGSELTQLTDATYADLEPAWSADGNRLLFVSNRDSKGDVRETSIYMMDMASYKVTRLTNASDATDGGPAWLDQSTVVFHSNRVEKHPQSGSSSDWNIWQVKIN